MIKEACVETVEDAIRAEELGANRIELCSRLDLDGITPSIDLVRQVRKSIGLPMHVMIRPEPKKKRDEFLVDEEGVSKMISSIDALSSENIQGFVLGVLNDEKLPDLHTLRIVSEHVRGHQLTFHKAIDRTVDPITSFDLLQRSGLVTGVLTSGGAQTAWQGREVLKKMISRQDSTEVIVAGRVTNENLLEIDQYLSARAYHGRRIVG